MINNNNNKSEVTMTINTLKTWKEIVLMNNKDFQDLLKENTDKNYHTENVLYLAFRSKDVNLIEEAKIILFDHLHQGSLSHENSERRTQLMTKIKSTFLKTYQTTYWQCL